MGMTIITVEEPKLAAQHVLELLKEQQDEGKLYGLSLATGSTMIPVYETLVNSEFSFEEVTPFNLDEYVGLEDGNKNKISGTCARLYSKIQYNYIFMNRRLDR